VKKVCLGQEAEKLKTADVHHDTQETQRSHGAVDTRGQDDALQTVQTEAEQTRTRGRGGESGDQTGAARGSAKLKEGPAAWLIEVQKEKHPEMKNQRKGATKGQTGRGGGDLDHLDWPEPARVRQTDDRERWSAQSPWRANPRKLTCQGWQ